jgi:hypothetical protein
MIYNYLNFVCGIDFSGLNFLKNEICCLSEQLIIIIFIIFYRLDIISSLRWRFKEQDFMLFREFSSFFESDLPSDIIILILILLLQIVFIAHKDQRYFVIRVILRFFQPFPDVFETITGCHVVNDYCTNRSSIVRSGYRFERFLPRLTIRII